MVGKRNVSVSLSVREHHGKDESHHSCLPADVVVFPGSVKEVREVAKVCSSERIPMIPFGTGTGLEGGVGASWVRQAMYILVHMHTHKLTFSHTHAQGGVCVDLSKLDSILEVHTEDLYATVQPGITRVTLNTYLRDTGLWFPIGMSRPIFSYSVRKGSGRY